jgi:hypothetical protein
MVAFLPWFQGTLETMESQAIQELISTIMCPGLKFQGVASDGDAGISRIIGTSSAIGLRHPLDIEHFMKSLIRRYHSINKRNNGILNRVVVKLVTWFRYLIRQDLPGPQKKAMGEAPWNIFSGPFIM